MHLIFVLSAVAFFCGTAAQQREGNAVTLEETNNIGFIPYNFNYRTSNGISREENAYQDGDAVQANGQYTWTSPEGYTYTITYTSGRGGYHAKVPQLLPGPATPKGGPSGFPWAR